jgi:AraC family transcriptional regulator of adaptative response / DNA-3-methyladenine glycosylase II
MSLDEDVCYRALRTRDARFDGRFFVAVRSTGVYCRPICPARTPKRENCTFVPSAAAAQEAGYRPCLRCRPEASPGTPAWLGTSATVSRALRLISEGALDGGSVEDLAARLGIGDRHLRRLFLEHLGATPVAVAQTRRLLFAKKLIDETALPMTQVALSAGFSSLRRFNDAIRATYGRTPSELRRGRRGGRDAAGTTASEVTLKLSYRPPYNWDAVIEYLAARATPGVERVDAGGYARVIAIGDDLQGIVEVSPAAGSRHLRARIRLSGPALLIDVSERLRRIFDLTADPDEITCHLRADPRLAPALDRVTGLRIPGAWDGFELAVRAILGQQISVRGATTLAGRLASRFGAPLSFVGDGAADSGLRFVFPRPSVLATSDLTVIGLPRARAEAISRLAEAVASGDLVLDSTRSLEETVARLAALPGIGEWTAQYIAMRALREPDAFPASDLGLRRALASKGRMPTGRELLARAEAWRPWRAYAAMCVWMASATPSSA